MKINKNSWHYKYQDERLFKEGSFYPERSLCSYVRTLILTIFKDIGIFGMLGLFLFAMTFPVVGLFIENGYYNMGYHIVGLVFWCGIAIVFGVVMWEIHKDTVKEVANNTLITLKLKSKDEPKDKKPSIFKEYIKALHDKVCPTLEFEDKE